MTLIDTPTHYDGMMVSYAGSAEDVMLRRFFGDQESGFYVDVGAHDPVAGSVTHHFTLSGWRGINIEPLPAFFERLVEARPNDINLNVAASDSVGTLELIVNKTEPGLSTMTRELADGYERAGHHLERILVSARPLAEIVREYCPDLTVDFLKIDAEGHELEVLRGVDLGVWRPRIVLIEAGYKPEVWAPILTSAGYVLSGSDLWNRYYVRSEEGERAGILRCPANVCDHFIAFDHTRALQARAEWESLGPLIRTTARSLRRMMDSNPRLKTMAKELVRRFFPRLLRDSAPGGRMK
jgi:FkbM family methyltransferase